MLAKPAVLLVPVVVLVMSGCLGGNDRSPSVTTRDHVQRLSVSEPKIRARGLTDGDIPSLARLKDLRVLDFSAGWASMPSKITDKGLAEIAKLDLPHLEFLTLGWCDEITDAGLAHIGRMHTITWLGLTSCPKITDAGLRELINAKNLTGLDLRGCPNITDDGIQQLAAKTNLGTILLGGCPKLTPQGVAKLQAALPNANVKKDDQEWGSQGPESHHPRWRKP